MKKLRTILALSVALIASHQQMAFSQITIDATNLTNYLGVGTSWMSYQKNDGAQGIGIGTASSSVAQTWTIPAMAFTDSGRADNISPANSPYLPDFPSAGYAQRIRQSVDSVAVEMYQFIGFSNDTIYALGGAQHMFGTVNGHQVDTTLVQHVTKILDVLPWHLGYNRVSSLDTTQEAGGYTKIEKITTVCDAFGTLNLPIGSFQALRMKSTDLDYYYYGSTLSYVDTSYYYQWMTREGHRAEVDGVQKDGQFVDATAISLTYVVNTPTAVRDSHSRPETFALEQNYPNPFNPSTMITYGIQRTSNVTLKVYDMLGREVRTLVNEVKEPGRYQVQFDAKGLPSGVYFYRLAAGNQLETKKLVLTK